MSYTFRLRFKISGVKKLGIEEAEILLSQKDNIKIILGSSKRGQSIKDSDELLLKGTGYDTEEIAKKSGEKSRDTLSLAFSKLRFPAIFGDRSTHGQFFDSGLKMLETEISSVVLNDVHGLQTYSSLLEPRFAKLENFTAIITTGRGATIETILATFGEQVFFSDRKRLAYELFSASMFSTYIDSRFLLLMMAIETLIEQNERSADELEQIDKLIKETLMSEVNEKESLIGGLRSLRTESVGSAGRRLASKVSKSYMGLSSSKFFMQCYEVRSKLVHGVVPRIKIEDIGDLIGELEQFVSDLICLPNE